MSTEAERIVAQLEQEQKRYDDGEIGAKPAIDLAREQGHVTVSIPNRDEWVHRDVLLQVGYYRNGFLMRIRRLGRFRRNRRGRSPP